MRVIAGLLALAILGTTQAAPVSYTTKGSIVLSCDGVEVSRHTVETEMSERALKYAVDHGGKASCVAKYPDKTIVFDIPLSAAPPPPVCPAKPADQTQPGTCPAGTTGTWTQTQTYASAPAPTCWTPSGYLPTSPPAGACVAIPPPLGVPTLSATQTPNAVTPANSDVKLTWTAVATATSYELERCGGPSCTTFTALATVAVLTYTNSNLPPAFSFSYRVRAADATRKGAYSNVVTLVTPTAPPPPPPPPVGTGSATVQWTPPTLNTDGTPLTDLAGFRVYYGTAPGALLQTITVANASLSTYVVDKLTAGTYYFAVRAYTASGFESANSNVASKVIP